MAGRAKLFELLDFPKFARPAILSIQAQPTARELNERLTGTSFMSYGQVWPRMEDVVRGYATEAYIKQQFNAYGDAWKNETIRNVVRMLCKIFGGKGTWYPERSKPKYILGFWFKPSIKGIWFFEGKAYAVLINARKTQPLSPEDVRFLARGVYELHCIDDPNDPIPLIIDLAELKKGKGRELRLFPISANEAVPLAAFERSVREFLNALHIAGISLPLPPLENVMTLFRR
jgi:hypothetical protein